MDGNPFDIVGFALIISSTLKKYIDKHRLKCAFADEIDSELDALEEAYSDLLMTCYLLYGATFIGAIIPPVKQENTINKIVDSYQNSILKMENSLVMLGKKLKIHESDLYAIIGNDYTNKMIMQNLLAAINVEKGTIDWQSLSESSKVMKVAMKNIPCDSFPMKLNEALKPFTDEIKVRNIIADDIYLSNVEKMKCLWLNKEFRRKYIKLLQEYTD